MGRPTMKRFTMVAAVASLAIATPIAAQAPNGQVGPDANAAAAEPYRVNPGDELAISVWGEERLAQQVRVLPDGSFSYPLVGKINAAGMVPTDIEARIERGLEPQFRGAVPQVTVSVRGTTGFQFSVIGRVRNPGTFTPGRYINALEALSFAGGPTEFAKLEDIYIVRKSGGGLEPVRVRLGQALRRSPQTLTAAVIPQVQSGDTVVVP